MSEYIRLYRLRQDKRWKLKSIKKKASPDKYWALKDEIDELSAQIEKLRKEDDARIQAAISMGNKG